MPRSLRVMKFQETSALDQPHPLLSKLLAPCGYYDEAKLRKRLYNKTVLVTGSSRGIGRALSLRLARAGARVLLASRSGGELIDVCEEISREGGKAWTYEIDLRDPKRIDELAKEIIDQHGAVDIVVHNAGKSIRRSIYNSLDRMHDFERTIKVNYLGPVQLQLLLLPSMIKKGRGHIVNVSTIGVRLPPAVFWAAYIASKAAFDSWMGSVAPELKASGISCSRIHLGLVHTAMSAPTKSYASLPGQTPDQAASVLCRAIVERPRTLGPWWLGPARAAAMAIEPAFDWWQQYFGPHSPRLLNR